MTVDEAESVSNASVRDRWACMFGWVWGSIVGWVCGRRRCLGIGSGCGLRRMQLHAVLMRSMNLYIPNDKPILMIKNSL